MTVLSDWPALRSDFDPADLPAELVYERGVWGKVHGEHSDFRWIARSPGFQHQDDRLAQALGVGSEDEPLQAVYWRFLDGRYYAVSSYSSRAVDAAGRPGGLEKQVLELSAIPPVPPVMAALLLLPQVAQWTDAVWYNRQQGQPWSDPRFALPIDAGTPVPCSIDRLEQAIDRGLAVLSQVNVTVLQACYLQLLSRQRPAWLGGLQHPLPPEALAALLLPLEREQADTLSLAGWIPSRRYTLEELGSRWDIVVLPGATGAETLTAEPAMVERAESMSQAVLERKPGLLRALEPRRPAVTASQDNAAPELSKKPPQEPSQEIALIRPGIKLNLTKPPPDTAPLISKLYEFASAVDKRWLDPKELEDYGGEWKPLPALEERLCDWLSTVKEHRPPHADEEQWQVKVDLLRALALVLAPGTATLERIGLPDSNRVPALLYVDLLDSWCWNELAKFGEDKLKGLIHQSLSCGDGRFQEQIVDWLQNWHHDTFLEDVRQMIAAELEKLPKVDYNQNT